MSLNYTSPIRLTENSVPETFLAMVGTNIFFSRSDGNDSEIYFYNGNEVKQITDNNFDESFYNFLTNESQILYRLGPQYSQYDLYFFDGTTSTRLNSYTYYSNGFRGSSGNSFVYEAYDGNDSELYLYNGARIIQLTSNNHQFESFHRMLGNRVAYSEYDGRDYELYLYDGANTIRLTNNDNYSEDFQGLSQRYVVWKSFNQLFLFNGVHTIPLASTANSRDRLNQISDAIVVYTIYDGRDTELYLYDGINIRGLTNNSNDDDFKGVASNHVVWEGSDGNDKEIFVHKIASNEQVNITNNSRNDDTFLAILDNGHVGYSSHDGNDLELYVYNGNRPIQLTNNTTSDSSFLSSTDTRSERYSTKYLVWRDTDLSYGGGGDTELFLYNGAGIVRLTDNTHNSDELLAISDNNVIYRSYNNGRWDLYVYDGQKITQLTHNQPGVIYLGSTEDTIVWRAYDGNDDELYAWTGINTVQLTNDNLAAHELVKISNRHILTRFNNELYIFKPSLEPYQYLASNLDVYNALGLNPGLAVNHYFTVGIKEGRETDIFDEYSYLSSNPDLVIANYRDGARAAIHWLTAGRLEGRSRGNFDPQAYLNRYADLRAVFGNNLEAATKHYIEAGFNEGRTWM